MDGDLWFVPSSDGIGGYLMQAGASARAVVDAQAIHPALAEGLQSLLMTLPRYAL